MPLIDDFIAFALTLPPLAIVLFVFFSAWLEFVFPPYLGDSAFLIGFFLAGQGAADPADVFVVAVVGAILGSIMAFLIGEKYGSALLLRFGRGKRVATIEAKVRQLFERHGEAILLVNRFLPFFRNFMIYGAGAFKLRMVPAMIANAISITVFMAMMLGLGLWAADSFDRVREAYANVQLGAGVAVVIGLGLWIAFSAWRAQRAVPDTPS
ncbi:MAG: VTT domain-containing protein [Acidobacteriota bacterium]